VSATDAIKGIGDIVIAVGGVGITVFAWLQAQTAKASLKEIHKGTTDALNRQLSLVLDPMTKQIDGTIAMASDLKALIAHVPQIDMIARDVVTMKSDLYDIRRDLGV
jgi:hypothetical protein